MSRTSVESINYNLLPVTLDNLRRDALPLGTEILSGGDQLDKPVRWAAVTLPGGGLPYLEGGEVLLVLPDLTDNLTLIRLIEAAQQTDVVAMLTVTDWPSAVLAAAQSARITVLQLPAGCRIREVEQSIISMLLNRTQHLEQRSVQIYQQLVQLASENSGLDRIIHELTRVIDKAVLVQDKRLYAEVSAVPPRFADDWDRLLPRLTQLKDLPVSFQDRHRLPLRTTPTLLQPIPDTGYSRLITPIVTQNTGRGYVSFIALAEDFSEIDSMISRHAAVICALEMARAKAINEIEKRLRGDFLDNLVMGIGSVNESEAIAEGDRFGHDMSSPHVALILRWLNNAPGSPTPSPRRLETLVNGLITRRPQAIFARLRETEVRIFYASDSASPIQAARQLAKEFQDAARHEYSGMALAIGIGSVAPHIGDWRTSYLEAVQAADFARRLKSEKPLYIGDLGIYTFLARPEYRRDLLALRDGTIGSLLGYEEKQRSDLLLTLNAFFEAHGNHTQTAELLNIHRNTLSYRMGRIAEITGLDLNQPDVRLAVHLALKVHKLLGAGE